MSATVSIRINGELHKVKARSLTELIDELTLSGRTIAIERNLEVVPRSQYATTMLSEGDRIELVHMIGGG